MIILKLSVLDIKSVPLSIWAEVAVSEPNGPDRLRRLIVSMGFVMAFLDHRRSRGIGMDIGLV